MLKKLNKHLSQYCHWK